MAADEKDKGARVFRKTRIYPLCSNLGICPQLVHHARRGLRITGSMERMAWRSSMKFERGVWYEKGAVTKKVVFSSTNIASRKRAFSLDNNRYHGKLSWC
jgi:hypothetical protein